MLIKTDIIGNLVRDAEIRDVNGRQVLSFKLAATAASWKDQQSGERKTKTEYADCAVWGATGSFDGLLAYLTKGRPLSVRATPDTSGAPAQGKNGQWYNNIKYTVARQDLTLIGGTGGQQAAPQAQAQQAPAQQQAYQQAPAQQAPAQQAPAQQVPAQQAPAQQQTYQQAPAQQAPAQQAAPQGDQFIAPPSFETEEDIPF